MTPQQRKWLDEHPKHEPVHFLGYVTMYGWTDDAWLLNDGTELPEAPNRLPYMFGAFSSGDTLYMKQPVLHVARKYMIA